MTVQWFMLSTFRYQWLYNDLCS